MNSSGRFILKGKWPAIQHKLHMIIRAEELAHSRVFREPFSIHPEVAERMEATNADHNS